MVSKFYMADVPDTGGGAPAPAPTPEPAPQPQQTSGGVDLEQRFQLTKNGQPVFPTLGELAKNYIDAPDSEQMSQFGLYQKAVTENDAEAAQQLLQSFGVDQSQIQQAIGQQPVADTPRTPEEVQQLQEELSQIKQMVSGHNPIIQQHIASQEQQVIHNSLQSQQDKYPFLVKHPEGAQLAHNRLNEIRNFAKTQRNIDLNDQPSLLKQAAEKAFADVEQFLSHTAQAFGLNAAQQAATQYTSVNDQNPDNPGGAPPGGWEGQGYIPPKTIVDTTQPTPNTAPGQPPLPTQPVLPPTGTGQATPPQVDPKQQAFKPGDLRNMVAQRTQQLRG